MHCTSLHWTIDAPREICNQRLCVKQLQEICMAFGVSLPKVSEAVRACKKKKILSGCS